ncbi:MAG: hypothetical protein R2845_10485 [Thermomicrobiales bacterium]
MLVRIGQEIGANLSRHNADAGSEHAVKRFAADGDGNLFAIDSGIDEGVDHVGERIFIRGGNIATVVIRFSATLRLRRLRAVANEKLQNRPIDIAFREPVAGDRDPVRVLRRCHAGRVAGLLG